MQVRLARPEDGEAIRAIYNLEVTTSTVTMDLVPRTSQDQRRWQQERSGAHAVIVAVIDDVVVGFGSLSGYRSRPGYASTVEDSVYVHRSHQGCGVGRGMLTNLIQVASAHGFHRMMARIAGGHDASIGLHRSLGFELVGTESEVGRKFGRWIDIALLQRAL